MRRLIVLSVYRLLTGGARGPGIFFTLPCVDSYTKVDMRVVTFDVPPQEVGGRLVVRYLASPS